MNVDRPWLVYGGLVSLALVPVALYAAARSAWIVLSLVSVVLIATAVAVLFGAPTRRLPT